MRGILWAIVMSILVLTGCEQTRTVDTPAPAANPVKTAPPTPTAPANAAAKPEIKMEQAMFGAGCFWGVEYIFRQQAGVSNAVSGYSGGKVAKPTYKQVCYDETGHAEVVQVSFDPAVISFEQLTDIFFRLHDPTQVNGQGPDLGDQYRSVIFYATPEQMATAQKVKERRQASGKYKKPIATTIEPAQAFYPAEEYHQRHYEKNGEKPYCHFLRPE